MLASVGAARRITSKIRVIAGARPMMPSVSGVSADRPSLRRCRSRASRLARVRLRAEDIVAISLSFCQGFSTKSTAPRFSASTASPTVPKPVISTADRVGSSRRMPSSSARPSDPSAAPRVKLRSSSSAVTGPRSSRARRSAGEPAISMAQPRGCSARRAAISTSGSSSQINRVSLFMSINVQSMTCGHGFLRFSGWHGVCETGDMSDAMDRPLTQTRWQRWRKPALAGLAVLTAGWVGWQVERTMMVPSAHLARRDITIGAVERGRMHDFIPLRAEVVPHDTVYVDSVDGGRIERILANPGDMVEAGQPLVAFSNTQLELTVLEKEGQLIQSITLQETYQTQLEQSRLANETALAQIDWNIVRLSRLAPRRKELAAKGYETVEGREQIEDELAYWQRRKPLQEDSNKKQEEIRLRQLPQIEAQLKMIQQDMQITRSKLDSLLVKAPAAGQVTT